MISKARSRSRLKRFRLSSVYRYVPTIETINMTQMHMSISEVEKPHTMAIETSSIDFAGPVGKNVRYRYLPIVRRSLE